jgi:hypothetical protein
MFVILDDAKKLDKRAWVSRSEGLRGEPLTG